MTPTALESAAKALSNATSRGWCKCGDDDVHDNETCQFCTNAAQAAVLAYIDGLTTVQIIDILAISHTFKPDPPTFTTDFDAFRAALKGMVESDER